MRILFIANSVGLYGANRSMIDLAAGLQKLGQDVFFMIPLESSGEERYALRKTLEKYRFTYAFIKYFPSVHPSSEKDILDRMFRMEANRKSLLKMKEYAIKWKIDIIHTNSLTHLAGAILSRQMKKPHVWHIREALKQDYDLWYDSQWLYRKNLKKAGKVICISDYVRKEHAKILKGASVTVMRNGLQVGNYLLNERYKKSVTAYHLLICGVIQEGKGQLDAVKGIYYLVHKYGFKKVHLQIVGDCNSDYSKKIKKFIMNYGLNAYIEILPFQENLTDLRRNADIALMCSRNEALGRVTIESMLSENLVIGADSAGTAEIIEDGVTGYLYKPGDARDLSEKIYRAIMRWEEQEKVVKAAKEYAKIHYDVNRYAENILRIYQKLVSVKQ